MLSIGYEDDDSLRLDDDTMSINLKLRQIKPVDVKAKSKQIVSFLTHSEHFPKGIGRVYSLKDKREADGNYSLPNSMELEIKKRIEGIIQNLNHETEIDEENIIGYGLGLTPSADDFLLGVLSVLEAKGQERRRVFLENYIHKYYEGTTEVSKYMLYYGVKHHIYPEFLQDFLLKPVDKHENFSEFLAHGSTSGTDLLTGIKVGCDIL